MVSKDMRLFVMMKRGYDGSLAIWYSDTLAVWNLGLAMSLNSNSHAWA